MKIFSIDAEVDGLYGISFAIAVTIRKNGKEISSFQGRSPDSGVKDQWVIDNVLPALVGMPITHDNSTDLEEGFWAYWEANKNECIVIAHCGSPVESGLFRRCVERDVTNRTFSGPYPAIHDVATLLLFKGYDPSSVDGYNASNNINIPFDGEAHHPMYDAISAAVAWERLIAYRL